MIRKFRDRRAPDRDLYICWNQIVSIQTDIDTSYDEHGACQPVGNSVCIKCSDGGFYLVEGEIEEIVQWYRNLSRAVYKVWTGPKRPCRPPSSIQQHPTGDKTK